MRERETNPDEEELGVYLLIYYISAFPLPKESILQLLTAVVLC